MYFSSNDPELELDESTIDIRAKLKAKKVKKTMACSNKKRKKK